MRVADAARCLDLDYAGSADDAFSGAAVDSREIEPGNLFVCIKGENADGHDYALAAQSRGASAILAQRPLAEVDIPVLVAADVVGALGKIAAYCRSQSRAKVICITGTAGKTTLKDTLAAIMARKEKVAATKGNHNNQIGLPLTILNSAGDENFWILEAGISHAGDMDELGAIATPDLALILNVGIGHTGGLGDKGVAWHKTRLLKYLSPGGIALISGDYPDLTREAAALGIRPVVFSAASYPSADFAVVGEMENGVYCVRHGGTSSLLKTPFMGAYGAETAIAAVAAASLCGANMAEICSGLESAAPPPQRFALRQVGRWHVFDDTYNANPLSMRRMMEAAGDYAARHSLPLFAVLGEMGELGTEAARCHEKLGLMLGRLKPAKIFWKGDFLDNLRDGINKSGFCAKIFEIDDGNDFAMAWKKLSPQPQEGVIIFKGSRVNRLERMLDAFIRMHGEGNVL